MSRRRPRNQITLTFTIDPDHIAARVAAIREAANLHGLINFDQNFTDILFDFVDEVEAAVDWREELFEEVHSILYDATEDLQDQYNECQVAENAKAVQS
jgi:enoyl-[acyl-carrier-protein] reductase (NADH)